MRNTLHALWRSRFVVFMCGSAMLLVTAATAFSYYSLKSVSAPLIVHFSESNGIDHVGTFRDIVEIGILGMVIVAMNSLIVLELEKRKLFWAKFLGLATLYIAALIFIGVLVIISVN